LAKSQILAECDWAATTVLTAACYVTIMVCSRILAVAALLVLSTPAFAQKQNDTINGASSAHASGLLGGAQGGYNWQIGPAVYGLEADFSAIDLNSSTNAALICTGRPC